MKVVSVSTPDINELVIEFVDSNEAFMNALRRVILADIPSMAIEDIVFYENSGVMENEIVAHRVGLIPLTSYSLDSHPRVSMDIVAQDTITVYAKDMVCEHCTVLYPDIPITKLGKGQRLKFVGHACKATGEEHSKWRVVSNCHFKRIDHGHFKFFIESIGALSCHDIFQQALGILIDKIRNSKNILLDACKKHGEE